MQRILFVALLACFACQRYVESDVAPSIVGTDVRVSLSDKAAGISFSRIGSRVRQAEGRVLQESDSSVAIGVHAVTRIGGISDGWGGDTVVFNRSDIVGIEQRQFSKSRTWLTVGAFVAAAIVAGSGIRGAQGAGGGQPPPGGGH